MSQVAVESVERQASPELPKSWQGRMEAVVAGAVDYDDCERLVGECIEVANQAGGTRTTTVKLPDGHRTSETDSIPIWTAFLGIPSDIVSQLMEKADPNSEVAKRLVQCGRVADGVEALHRVLAYNWHDESEDYDCRIDEASSGDHIFLPLVAIANWLEQRDWTPEQYILDGSLRLAHVCRTMRQYAVEHLGCDAYCTDQEIIRELRVAVDEGRASVDEVRDLIDNRYCPEGPY